MKVLVIDYAWNDLEIEREIPVEASASLVVCRRPVQQEELV